MTTSEPGSFFNKRFRYLLAGATTCLVAALGIDIASTVTRIERGITAIKEKPLSNLNRVSGVEGPRDPIPAPPLMEPGVDLEGELICEDLGTQNLINKLKKHCPGSEDKLKRKICTKISFQSLLMNEGHELIAQFPRLITLHFRDHHPSLKGDDECSDGDCYYLDRLREHGPMLANSKLMFVMAQRGPASEDKREKNSYDRASARLRLGARMASDVVRGVGTEPNKLKPQFVTLERGRITPELLLNKKAVITPIAGDRKTTERLDRIYRYGVSEPGDQEFLDAQFERITILIALPCDGTEEITKIPKVIQDAEEAIRVAMNKVGAKLGAP